jgi:hypothetical protein
MGKTLSTNLWLRTPERGCYFSTLDFRPAACLRERFGRQAQSRLLATGRLLDLAKLKERSLNFYESKGPLWKTWEQSLSVTEKKGVRR